MILFCLLNRKYYVILYRLQSIKFNFPSECEKDEMKIEGKTTLYFYHFRHYIQEFRTASPCFFVDVDDDDNILGCNIVAGS